jgi:hypothetical protein
VFKLFLTYFILNEIYSIISSGIHAIQGKMKQGGNFFDLPSGPRDMMFLTAFFSSFERG